MHAQDDQRPPEGLTPLSPAESEMLQIVWTLGQATVQQVCDALPPQREIAYATVQTLLRRLHAKGYVEPRKRGRAHVFHPVARREEVIRSSVSDFVKRLFGGDPAPLMLHLADEADLSEAEIERIKGLLDSRNKPGKH